MKKIIILGVLSLEVLFWTGCTSLIQPPTTPPDVVQQPTEPVQSDEDDSDDNETDDDVATVQTDLKTYQNQQYGFEFQYPNEWKSKSGTILTEFGHKDCIWFDSDFSINIWDTSTYSFDELKAAPPGGIDPDSVTEENITLDGNSATEISYTQIRDAGSESNQMKKISFLRNNLVYIIECTANDCTEILPTFKFTE